MQMTMEKPTSRDLPKEQATAYVERPSGGDILLLRLTEIYEQIEQRSGVKPPSDIEGQFLPSGPAAKAQDRAPRPAKLL
jgi:hypothetical protein